MKEADFVALHHAHSSESRVPDTQERGSSLATAVLPAAMLAGCGGGGGGGGGGAGVTGTVTNPSVPPGQPAPVMPTDAEAVRFLTQAGFSASYEDIAAVKSKGYAAWLDEQLALPYQAESSRYLWMVARNYGTDPDKKANVLGFDNSVWCKLIGAPDQVRQKMVLALSEIFVVAIQGVNLQWQALALAHYADLLEQHAFGNYRTLLEEVTLSVAMGGYLNMLGNNKTIIGSNSKPSSVPDENYAREIMQLFSIGLVRLNMDGTPQLDANGQIVETYSQEDITQLAKVFTGWQRDSDGSVRESDGVAIDYWQVLKKMKHTASRFERGDKTVLGVTISSALTGPEAMSVVLDLLAQHPNVGPFIGRQLIQRLTQSHPSRAYVARVAAVFNDNGKGERGDLKAVFRAILLDPEARPPRPGNASGRLREPLQRFIQWARTFKINSKSGVWPIGNTSDPGTQLGQSPFRSPSVFNFFRPGYIPPSNELAQYQITAPEFQICNESSVAGYLNFMQSVIKDGCTNSNQRSDKYDLDMLPDYTFEISLATDPKKLLEHLNLCLAANAIDNDTLAGLIRAVGTIAADTEDDKKNRVYAAVLLVMAAPQYLVQK